jgi:ribosomal protein L21E
VKKLVSGVSLTIFIALVMLLVTNFALPCMPAQAAESSPKCWGVIVGVSDYYYNYYLDPFTYADNDAQDLYDTLSPAWGISHIRLLKNSQATKRSILDAIDWLADNAGADDTVLFSFSGLGDLGGIICPYDLNYLAANGISATELSQAISPIKARKIVVILQSWGSGAFQNDLSSNGRVILMSSVINEVTWMSNELRHSVFDYYILQALDRFDLVDVNDDYELSAEEIFDYASLMTSEFEMEEEYTYIQHPVIDDRYSGELPLLSKFTFVTDISVPAGTTILTLDGVNYTSPSLSLLWVPGVSHTMTVPQVVNAGGGIRYSFTGWNDGDTSTTKTVSKGSFTANYQKEHQLTIISAVNGTQGAGWYKDGATATFSLTPNIETSDTRHFFTGWGGAYSGISSTGSLVMNAPKAVTANWRNEYLLTVNSAYGNPTGTGWYKEGDTATFSVASYIETSDTKHYFTGWSGNYSGTSSSASLIMNGPNKVTTNWRHEYLLTINSDYGSPTGAGWYKEGERANISVEPTQGFIIRHYFTGWSGDLADTNPSSSINMNSPKVITATWQTDFVQLYILIGIVGVLGGAITTTVILMRRSKGQSNIA